VAEASGVQLLGLKESGFDFVAADMPERELRQSCSWSNQERLRLNIPSEMF
jgi:hypothetical protein